MNEHHTRIYEMPEVLEITTFKLAGRSAADFVTANDDINVYLKSRPGFRWRRITQHDDGTVIDIVAWDTVAEAEAGASGIMTDMRHSPVHSTIDMRTVDWRLVPVLQHTN
jgi:hypothetical protein